MSFMFPALKGVAGPQTTQSSTGPLLQHSFHFDTMCLYITAIYFFVAVMTFALGYLWGHRRAVQAAVRVAQQHQHTVQALDSFKTVVSSTNTRAGHYLRFTTTFQPGRLARQATPTCCSKPT